MNAGFFPVIYMIIIFAAAVWRAVRYLHFICQAELTDMHGQSTIKSEEFIRFFSMKNTEAIFWKILLFYIKNY